MGGREGGREGGSGRGEGLPSLSSVCFAAAEQLFKERGRGQE